MHLEHVNLTVSDLDRSIDFYSRLLGLRVRWQGESAKGGRAAHIGDDHSYLALFESTGSQPTGTDLGRVGLNHIGFVIDDLDGALVLLEELGTPAHAEHDYEPGHRAYFFDPDHIEIELVSYTGGS